MWLTQVEKQVPIDRIVEVQVEKIVEVPVPYEVVKEVEVYQDRVVLKEDGDKVQRLEAEIRRLEQDKAQCMNQLKRMEDVLSAHQLHSRSITLEVPEQDERKATLAWQNVPGADTYEVQVSEFHAKTELEERDYILSLRDRDFKPCFAGAGLSYTHFVQVCHSIR